MKQNCILCSEGQKACRPHKPCGALRLFRSAKTSWKKGFTNESKRKEPTCSYKDRATIRLLAPHSRACDRNHCLGKLCWLARRRWEATGAGGGTWLCFFSGRLSLLLRRAGCLLSDASVGGAGFISADKEKHYVCYSVERSRSIWMGNHFFLPFLWL